MKHYQVIRNGKVIAIREANNENEAIEGYHSAIQRQLFSGKEAVTNQDAKKLDQSLYAIFTAKEI
jgi:hypothetical protein